MRSNYLSTKLDGASVVARLFGTLAGVGGITHGVGEVLQGNVRPDGLAIHSWTQGPIATNMGGEPGITVVPNLLVTGLLAIIVSLATAMWATSFVQRRHGGRILIGLSTMMLLVGGGIGPPLLGILAGIAGTKIGRPLTGWRSRLSLQTRRLLAALWPVLFAFTAVSGSFLVVGSLLLVFLFGVNNAALFLNTFYFTMFSLSATVFLSPFYDNREDERAIMVAD